MNVVFQRRNMFRIIKLPLVSRLSLKQSVMSSSGVLVVAFLKHEESPLKLIKQLFAYRLSWVKAASQMIWYVLLCPLSKQTSKFNIWQHELKLENNWSGFSLRGTKRRRQTTWKFFFFFPLQMLLSLKLFGVIWCILVDVLCPF